MRHCLICLVLVAVLTGVSAQIDLDAMGPRLSVPSPDTHLFFKTQPVVPDSKLLIPAAAINRWLGEGTVVRAGDEIRFAFLGGTNSAVRLTMWVGQARAAVARAEVPLEAAPRVIDDKLFLPFKFIAESVGIWVEHHGHQILLRKPDLGWEAVLAIPPHPMSLEGKLVALAVAREPKTLRRVESVSLSEDTMSGAAIIAEPSEDGESVVRYVVTYTRDKAGWHFASRQDPPQSPQTE